MLCPFDAEKVDSKTNMQMLKELNMIKTYTGNNIQTNMPTNNSVNKWWQFWK